MLAWTTWAYTPEPGADASWQFGLSWASSLGLQWAPDIAFTYGPLGYTLAPMLLPVSQVVIAGFLHILAAGVTVASFHALLADRGDLRPSLTVILAALTAAAVLIAGLGITGLVPGGRMSALVIAGIPLALVVLQVPSRWPLVTAALVVGIVAHQKLSDAALIAGLMAIAALGRRDRRDLPLFLVLALGVWFAVWLVVGQDPAHLPGYIASVIAIVSGYASAMAIEESGYEWTYAPAIVVSGLLLAQAWMSVRGRPARTRVTLVAMVGWLVWVSFRQGFVRHDLFHSLFFFVTVLVLSITLLVITRRGWAIGLGALTCAVPVLVLTLHGVSFVGLLDRGKSLDATSSAWTAVTDADARGASWRAALDRSTDAYEIPASLIDEMGNRPTAVDPLEVSALAATRVTWDPVPVFQLYAAYTPMLDDVNARSIEERPRQVLRAIPPVASDDRNPYWESPRYQAAVYCGFDPAFETERWLLLRPAVVGRCGVPHDHVTVSATPGVPVDVPARPGAITLASVTYQQSVADVLMNTVFKGQQRIHHLRHRHLADALRAPRAGPDAERVTPPCRVPGDAADPLSQPRARRSSHCRVLVRGRERRWIALRPWATGCSSSELDTLRAQDTQAIACTLP